MTELLVGLGVMLLGAAAHLVANVIRMRSQGNQIGFIEYVKSRPYVLILNIMGGIFATSVLWESGALTLHAALLIGYAGDSILKNVAEPVGRKMSQKIVSRL